MVLQESGESPLMDWIGTTRLFFIFPPKPTQLTVVAADIFIGAALNAEAVPTNAAVRSTCAFTMVADKK